MIRFLAERVEKDSDFRKQLFQLIEQSKTDEKIEIAAANAILHIPIDPVTCSNNTRSVIPIFPGQ